MTLTQQKANTNSYIMCSSSSLYCMHLIVLHYTHYTNRQRWDSHIWQRHCDPCREGKLQQPAVHQ